MTRCWACNAEFGVDGSHICADTPFRVKAQQPAPVQENSCEWQCGYLQGVHDGVTKTRPAQQPRKAVKLTNEELVDHYCAIADGKEWAIGGLSDAVPFARAIEQAVWEKLGVTE